MEINTIANATEEVMKDLIDPNTDGLMLRSFKYFASTILNMMWWAGCCAAFLVGSVYFK